MIAEIPPKSYWRKLVGYLYAIEQGAEYIYETDDDKAATDGLLGFKYAESAGLEYDCEEETTSMFVNPYAYFGQPSYWPRGYPLELATGSINCSWFKLADSLPVIQQGLVNGDPDVNVIYRYLCFIYCFYG